MNFLMTSDDIVVNMSLVESFCKDKANGKTICFTMAESIVDWKFDSKKKCDETFDKICQRFGVLIL